MQRMHSAQPTQQSHGLVEGHINKAASKSDQQYTAVLQYACQANHSSCLPACLKQLLRAQALL